MLKNASRRRLLALLVFATLLAAGLPDAAAQQSGYSAWTDPSAPTPDSRLQSFVERLNKLVDDAEKARAADPKFLRDLRDLANGHSRPWSKRVFSDDFVDGDFTRNPAWSVTAGKYWVERGWGLRSAVKPGAATETSNSANTPQMSNEQRAAQIFGAILNQALGGKKAGQQQAPAAGQTAAAVIHSETPIPNGFSLEADISSWTTEGELQLAVYQGRFNGGQSPGYRLSYRPGGAFELLRVSSRGVSVVERSAIAQPIEDKKIHRIVWERHPDGRMNVLLDGKSLFETTDRGFRDAFNGLAVINSGGDYIIKGINIAGAG